MATRKSTPLKKTEKTEHVVTEKAVETSPAETKAVAEKPVEAKAAEEKVEARKPAAK